MHDDGKIIRRDLRERERNPRSENRGLRTEIYGGNFTG